LPEFFFRILVVADLWCRYGLSDFPGMVVRSFLARAMVASMYTILRHEHQLLGSGAIEVMLTLSAMAIGPLLTLSILDLMTPQSRFGTEEVWRTGGKWESLSGIRKA